MLQLSTSRARITTIAPLALAAAVVLVASSSTLSDPEPSILISRQLAAARGLEVGDTVRLGADAAGSRARAFRIAGIYEPTPDPQRINAAKHEARLHLPDLLALTAAPDDILAGENVDAISVAVAPGVDPSAYAGELAGRVPGVSAAAIEDLAGRAGLFVVLERFHLAIALVTIAASTVFLLALTVMLVDERRETVGVLRLIGLTARRILVQVFAEGLIIAGAGALFGIALALASEGLINQYFQWRYDTALVFVRITPDVVWQSLAISVPLGVIGSVIASWALLRRGALRLVRR
jgi:putative ABC transport system permease protein